MVRVGASGFGYHHWCPEFYPRNLAYEDYLFHYARRFTCCELNHTFHRMPTSRELQALAERVPESFRFTVKLHRSLTHERGALETARGFAAAARALADARRLGAVVAQFPFSFVNNPENRSYLCRLRAALELPLVAELRNGAWRHPETIDFLKGWGIGWVAIDSPLDYRLPPPRGMVLGEIGYVRMHGRDAFAWWRRGDPARYDYRYRTRELQSWIPRLREIARRSREVYVIFNNHGRGRAAANALALSAMLERASGAKAV